MLRLILGATTLAALLGGWYQPTPEPVRYDEPAAFYGATLKVKCDDGCVHRRMVLEDGTVIWVTECRPKSCS